METVSFDNLEEGVEFKVHSESPVYVKSKEVSNFANAFFKSSGIPIIIENEQKVLKVND